TLEKLSPGVRTNVEQVVTLEKNQANLIAIAEINGQSIGQSGYGYDLFRGSGFNQYSASEMDTTKANVSGTISAGATSVTITNAEGTFLPGQEVTLQDVVTDGTRERLTIDTVV